MGPGTVGWEGSFDCGGDEGKACSSSWLGLGATAASGAGRGSSSSTCGGGEPWCKDEGLEACQSGGGGSDGVHIGTVRATRGIFGLGDELGYATKALEVRGRRRGHGQHIRLPSRSPGETGGGVHEEAGAAVKPLKVGRG